MSGIQRRLVRCIAAASFVATTTCADGGPEKPTEPFGEYRLTAIGTRPLPVRWTSYLDGSYEEIVSGSLRFLSRGRVAAEMLTLHKNANGTVREEIGDTVIFVHRRSGTLVDLEFQDPLGVRRDTLDVETYFDQPALRARGENYARTGAPAPLKAGALYVKVESGVFERRSRGTDTDVRY